MRPLAFALAILALGATCDNGTGPDGALRRDLAAARARWRAQGFSDYALTIVQDCFCGTELRGPVVVVVRFGAVASRTYQETGQPVPAERARFFPDVEGLFDFIEEAIDEDAASIRAEFHRELGYPTVIFVDFEANVADEERGYRVSSLDPLR